SRKDPHKCTLLRGNFHDADWAELGSFLRKLLQKRIAIVAVCDHVVIKLGRKLDEFAQTSHAEKDCIFASGRKATAGMGQTNTCLLSQRKSCASFRCERRGSLICRPGRRSLPAR